MKQLLLNTLFLLALQSCGNMVVPQQGIIQAGRVDDATIEAFKIDDQGVIDPVAIATTKSDANGKFTIDIPAKGNVILRATGGSYYEETADRGVDNKTELTTTMEAVLTGAQKKLSITPLTHLAAAAAMKEISAGRPVKESIQLGNSLIAGYFALGKNITSILPDDPTQVTIPNSVTAKLACVLGGISQFAKKKSTTPGELNSQHIMEYLAKDVEDGLFDGKDRDGQAVQLADGRSFLPTYVFIELQQAVKEFQASPNGVAGGFTSKSVVKITVPTLE